MLPVCRTWNHSLNDTVVSQVRVYSVPDSPDGEESILGRLLATQRLASKLSSLAWSPDTRVCCCAVLCFALSAVCQAVVPAAMHYKVCALTWELSCHKRLHACCAEIACLASIASGVQLVVQVLLAHTCQSPKFAWCRLVLYCYVILPSKSPLSNTHSQHVL